MNKIITVSWRLSLSQDRWHLWDNESFNGNGLPVAHCRSTIELFPRDPNAIETLDELIDIPNCKYCEKYWNEDEEATSL